MAERQRSASDKREIHALIAEFLSVARCLAMPEAEQRNIIGVAEQDWDRCSSLDPDCIDVLHDVHQRRLSYVLPLMRRVAANQTPGAPLPTRDRAARSDTQPRTH